MTPGEVQRLLLEHRRAGELLDEERGGPVKIYAESSSVLAWLLGEDAARGVRDVLSKAELVLSSDHISRM